MPSIVTKQLAAPVQSPPHPTNVDEFPGEAVSVTIVPGSKEAWHVPTEQLKPAGLTLVTVPEPVPCTVTDSCWGTPLNVAVTNCEVLIVTVHVPVPLHGPFHP